MISKILHWFKATPEQQIGNKYTTAVIDLLQKRVEIKEERVKALKGDILALRELVRDIWIDLDQCAGRSGDANWMPSELRRETTERIIAVQGLRFGKGRIRNA